MDAPPCVSGVILLIVLYGAVVYALPWVVVALSSPLLRRWWPVFDGFNGGNGSNGGNGGNGAD